LCCDYFGRRDREGGIRLGFWETVLANLIPAIFAAALAAGFAYWFARRYTRRWDETRARRERDAAAAAEFYRAYGAFFAAWKSWDGYRKSVRTRKTKPGDRIPFLNRVADAEGALESFLIRLTQERNLEQHDLDRLWCFRTGYKQLRYSVRDDELLPWWRSTTGAHSEGSRHYLAFKRLSVGVAALLPSPDDRPYSTPDADVALRHLVFVAGPEDRDFRERWAASLEARVPSWVCVAEALDLPKADRQLTPARDRGTNLDGLES
jgi:hypothetical protein